MTISSSFAPPKPIVRPASVLGPLLVVCFALGLTLLLLWPKGVAVWQTGQFFDSDDAMRMAQARDLLAGQSWFDLHQWRLNPPDGLLMHWTRMVDAPLAALVRLFSLWAAPETAERLARLAFSGVVNLLLLVVFMRLGHALAGPRAVLPALAMAAMTGVASGQFQAGRVDHHAPQLLLLLWILDAGLRGLRPGRSGQAALVGVLAALSLAIGVEIAPYLVLACAIAPINWALGGPQAASAMRALALGLGGALLPAFYFFAPGGGGAAACDALSPAWLVAGLSGGAGLLALAQASDRLKTRAARFAGLGAAGLLTLGLTAALFPACLNHPYAAIDPLVRDLWLANVTEAQSIWTVLPGDAQLRWLMAAPPAVGGAALLAAVLFERGEARARWLVMLAACGIGWCLVSGEVRSLASLSLVSAFGAVWIAARLLALPPRTWPWSYPAILVSFLACGQVGWILFGPSPAAGRPNVLAGRDACRAPDQFGALADRPPGLALAPTDMGAHLLAHTPHSVLSAPYHRNNAGNRAAISMFLARPEQAEPMARKAGVAYVVFCAGLPVARAIVERSPDGLAAALARGETPAWLDAIPSTGPVKSFAIRTPGGPS